MIVGEHLCQFRFKHITSLLHKKSNVADDKKYLLNIQPRLIKIKCLLCLICFPLAIYICVKSLHEFTSLPNEEVYILHWELVSDWSIYFIIFLWLEMMKVSLLDMTPVNVLRSWCIPKKKIQQTFHFIF